MKNIVNIDHTLGRFRKAFDYYGKKGIPPQMSILRIEEELKPGKGSYNIQVKKEILSVTEKNLQRNDLFIVTALGVFLSVVDPLKPGTESLMPFAHLASGDIRGFKTLDINALMNGTISIRTGSIVNLADMPLSLFVNVPPIDGAAWEAGLPLPFNLLDNMYTVPEELKFAGTQDHKIDIEFPSFPNADYSTSPAGTVGKLVFMAVGYRIPGGTNDDYKKDPQNPFAGSI